MKSVSWTSKKKFHTSNKNHEPAVFLGSFLLLLFPWSRVTTSSVYHVNVRHVMAFKRSSDGIFVGKCCVPTTWYLMKPGYMFCPLARSPFCWHKEQETWDKEWSHSIWLRRYMNVPRYVWHVQPPGMLDLFVRCVCTCLCACVFAFVACRVDVYCELWRNAWAPKEMFCGGWICFGFFFFFFRSVENVFDFCTGLLTLTVYLDLSFGCGWWCWLP